MTGPHALLVFLGPNTSARLGVPVKYTKTAQTGETGVALVRKTVTDAGSIFRSFENADIGIDAAIELLNEARETSGDLVLAQIKTGRPTFGMGVIT